MTKNQTKCWNCGETFEFDANDTRPYVYHECKNQENGFVCRHAHSNPNLIRKFPVFVPKQESRPPPKKDHILREYFAYSFKQKAFEDDEEHDEKGDGVNQWGF